MIYSDCEVDDCTEAPIGDSGGGTKCTDVVPDPYLPYNPDFHMGITQAPGCGGHVGRLSEAYDFNVNGNYESSHMMQAVAANSGVVVEIKKDVVGGCYGCSGTAYAGGWGNHVVVQVDKLDGSGPSCFYERYAHFITNSVLVNKGARVCRGQALGYIGTTGNSTGEHLHFQRESASGQSVKVDFQEATIPSGCSKQCSTSSHLDGCYKSMNTLTANCGMPLPTISCTDGKQNGNETDVDCGGGCGKCSDGKKCSLGTDCQSGNCLSKSCQPVPSSGPCSGGSVPSITWAPKAQNSAIMDSVSANAVMDNKIHVFGLDQYNDHYVYDPGTNSWSKRGSTPPCDMSEGVAVVIAGSLYTFCSGPGMLGTAASAKYDSISDTWTRLSMTPWVRRSPAYGVIGGKAYIAGGYDRNGDKVTAFDPAADMWTTLAPLSSPGGLAASAVSDGKLYMFGGLPDRSSAKIYDPATNVWTALASMPVARQQASAVVRDGVIWVAGGRVSEIQSSISLYEIASNKWCDGPTMPEALSSFAMQIVNGRIYLIGGWGMTGVVNHVWEGTIR